MIRNLGQVAAIYIGSSAPRNTNLIWLDNTVVPFVFRAYDGSAWSEIATHKWVRAYVDGWLVTLPPRQLADDGDYMLINSNNVNYKITVKDFVKSAVGNPLDFKGVIRVSADFPNPSTLESGDMYVIITSPAGGTVTDPYSGKTFEDSEKIVWDEVTQSWESLGKIDITVDLTTSYSETEVTIHSSAGKETTIQGATDQSAGVMLPGQYSWLQALSNGSIVPGDPSPLTPLTPAHKHNYSDIVNRLVSQQGTGESTIDPMSQKATTDALNLKFDKASVLQVSGVATDKVMSQKAVTDALKTLSDDFNNKLTNYLPLAGGTMKGNIVFNNNLFLNWKDTKGSTYQVLSMKSNDEINIGNAAFPLNLYSKEDLFHKRNGESVYRIYDAYNLPDPATLSGNNTFTGNNTFQAGKFNVGSFKVASSGSLLVDINSQGMLAWSRNIMFRANSDNTSSFRFGGYNSTDNTSIGYAYIGIGDVDHSTAQYKFYSNRLEVPNIWTLKAGNYNVLNINTENNYLGLGSSSLVSYIVSSNSDLRHRRFSATDTYKDYIIWDAYNLPDPATLSGNNTFTGNNTFQAGKFNVGSFKVASSGSLLVDINSQGMLAWSRNIMFRANSDNTSSFRFGGYNSTDNTSIGYAYIGIGDVDHSTAQYKFYSNRLEVPNIWTLKAGNYNVLNINTENNYLGLGSSSLVSYIVSSNSDLRHRRFSATDTYKDYIIWDAYNLPTPASTTDLNNYLPLTGGTLTGQLTIKQSVDIKLRLQSTDTDNYCIIQAINAQASQLGVLGYAGDKWAIGHGGTYYEIWDKYNLTDPVTYTTNAYNHATLKNKDGQYFTYIKAGTNGLLPHSKATLTSGGSGSLGTSDQSFNAAYINNLHTNKVTFGDAGPYITGSTSAIQFLNAEGGVQKVATGGLYVGVSYASDALSLVPANGIYSSGVIKGAVGFSSNFRQANLNLASTAAYSLYISSFIEGSTSAPGADPISGRTVNDGVLLTYFWGGDFAFQLAGDIDGSGIAYRSYVPSTGVSSLGWRFLADTSWVINTIINKLTDYLPLTGGTLSGALTINTVGSVPFIANNNDINGTDVFAYFRVKGANKTSVGYSNGNGPFIQDATNDRCIMVKSDGVYFGTELGAGTKLALITDIPTVSGYLPLSGGTLTGTLKINSGGSEPLVINNSASAGEAYVVTKTQGTTRGVMGWNSSLGMFLQDSRGYTFSMKADGVYFGASSSTLTKLPTSTDLSGYLPLAGGTLTGALTMSSRRHGVVIDVIGGAGNTWDEGVGALSVQVPNDAGQTPLLLARRSGAAIDTTTAAERLLSMELLDDGHFFIIGMSGSKALQLDWTSGKAGTGKLFGKTIATTDQIPSIPSISISNSGTGNAVTSITANGHTLTVTKGATYLTSHQTIYNLTFQAGTFSAKTFDPNGAAATVNIPTNTSHLTNDSGFITSSALNGYATQSWVNSQNFVKSTSTKKVTDIQPVDALPATQVSGVLYLVFG